MLALLGGTDDGHPGTFMNQADSSIDSLLKVSESDHFNSLLHTDLVSWMWVRRVATVSNEIPSFLAMALLA